MQSKGLFCALLSVVLFASLVILPANSSGLTTNSTYGTAYCNKRSMVRASDGTLAFVYQKGSPVSAGNGLVLVVSRDNGQTWTQSLQVALSSSVFPDMEIGPDDALYVVYATNKDAAGSSNDVTFAKLLYNASARDWSLERRSTVWDSGTSDGAFNCALARDDQNLWCAFRYLNSSGYAIRVRYSSDDGLTWQTALASAETPGPNADETAAFALTQDRLALIIYRQDTKFDWRWRSHLDPPTDWQPVQTIYTVTSPLPSKSGYSVLVDEGQGIHLLFAQHGIKHMVYKNGAWAATPTLLTSTGSTPSLSTDGQDLWAYWQNTVGDNMHELLTQRFNSSTGAWDPARYRLNHPSEQFATAAFCYSSATNSYTDVTVGAANTSSSDVRHATTLRLVRDAEDAFYFGAAVPFTYLRFYLSTSGSGGTVSWEYWNGAGWAAISPASGPYAFTKTASIRLWPSLDAYPGDWTRVSVNGSSALYFIRARATASQSTAPVGRQVSSFEVNRYGTAMRRDGSNLVVAWVRGSSKPYAIETREIPWSSLGGASLVRAVSEERTRSGGERVTLYTNSPNPFNPQTTIRFVLSEAGHVRLSVYDVMGRTVASLIDQPLAAGPHAILWDGTDVNGAPVASGIYWSRLEALGGMASHRMVLLK